MSESSQLNIRKVSKHDSDFIFSMTLKVKHIYMNGRYAIVSFLNGRDIGVVQEDILLIEIGKEVFSTLIFSEITKEFVKIKTPDGSRMKSDIKSGIRLGALECVTLDIFKNEICKRYSGAYTS